MRLVVTQRIKDKKKSTRLGREPSRPLGSSARTGHGCGSPGSPSTATLWHGLKDVGDGHREVWPMAMSCNKLPRKLITTISGTACRFRLEVEFEEGRLHKLSKVSTGRSLTRLACVQQLFEAFLNRIQAYSLPADVGLMVFNQTPRLVCAPSAFSEVFRDEVEFLSRTALINKSRISTPPC